MLGSLEVQSASAREPLEGGRRRFEFAKKSPLIFISGLFSRFPKLIEPSRIYVKPILGQSSDALRGVMARLDGVEAKVGQFFGLNGMDCSQRS